METPADAIGPFKVSGTLFARLLFSWHLRRAWWAYALPLAACLGLAVADVRFVLVALMALFLMIPMALFFINFYYGLDPVNRYNIMNKTLQATAEGLTLQMDEAYNMRHPQITIPWQQVKSRTARQKCLVINLNGSLHQFIAIPLETFTDTLQLRQLVEAIDKKAHAQAETQLIAIQTITQRGCIKM